MQIYNREKLQNHTLTKIWNKKQQKMGNVVRALPFEIIMND